MTDIAIMPDDGVTRDEAAFRAAKRRLEWRRRVMPLMGVLGALALWAGLVYGLEVPPFIAPSPRAVAHTLVAKYDLLLRNLTPTAIEAIAGFLLGNLAAITIATVFVHKKVMEEALFPMVVLINTIPVVAKAPILVLLFGNGMEPKIAIAALVCFFPTLVNMVRGLESVNPQAIELMRVLSASKREVFFKIRVHNSLPYLFSALKIAASTAVIGACSPNTCAHAAYPGDACDGTTSVCVFSNCRSGKCVDTAKVGQPCMIGTDCASGTCSHGACADTSVCPAQ